MNAKRFLILTIPFLFITQARASDPITIDGRFDDWAKVPVLFSDINGDGLDEDFEQLRVTNDDDFLFVFFSFHNFEHLLQEVNQIKIFIDADNSTATGLQVNGIGADIEWCFGARQGLFHTTTGPTPTSHAALTLRTAPTITSRVFELGLRLDSVPMTLGGTQVADTIRVVLRTTDRVDFLPDNVGGARYVIDTSPVGSAELIPLAREETSHIRLLTYNTLFGGLLITARQPYFERILRALSPDIMAFQEQDNPGQVKDAVGAWLQDSNLHSVGFGSNTVISKFPILEQRILTTSGRSMVVLLDTKSRLGSDLLLINSHFSCCQNNSSRQRDADEIISILRDFRSGNGPFSLPEGTPIVHVGDFNFVGSSGQLKTLIEGNIIDEFTFGPDFAPDWDGTAITDLFSRHTSIRMGYTWRNDNSSFTPGKLDYVLYTDSVIDLRNHFILNTLAMSQQELDTYELQATDTNLASDHLPRIFDMAPMSPVRVEDRIIVAQPRSSQLFPAYPNPFNPTTTIGYTLSRASHTTLKVYDLLGREVAVLVDEHVAAGDHQVVFDASRLASGVYLYKFSSGGFTETRRVVLTK